MSYYNTIGIPSLTKFCAKLSIHFQLAQQQIELSIISPVIHWSGKHNTTWDTFLGRKQRDKYLFSFSLNQEE